MMSIADREDRILGVLTERGRASVTELSHMFEVSQVTIRSDLGRLAEQGRVFRTHGGVRLADERTRQEYTFAARRRIRAEEKRRIGVRAAHLVEPGEAILLDASTTAVAVAQALKGRDDLSDVTVVTSGIWTALELLGAKGITVALTGGYVRTVTGSITGLIAYEVLSQFNFHRSFLGAHGITLEHGLTDQPMVEVELKRNIIQRVEEVNAVADGSKFGRAAVASFAETSRITRIITDPSAPLDEVEALRRRGVEILIA